MIAILRNSHCNLTRYKKCSYVKYMKNKKGKKKLFDATEFISKSQNFNSEETQENTAKKISLFLS